VMFSWRFDAKNRRRHYLLFSSFFPVGVVVLVGVDCVFPHCCKCDGIWVFCSTPPPPPPPMSVFPWFEHLLLKGLMSPLSQPHSGLPFSCGFVYFFRYGGFPPLCPPYLSDLSYTSPPHPPSFPFFFFPFNPLTLQVVPCLLLIPSVLGKAPS